MLRKLPSPTIHNILWQSHSQGWRLLLLGLKLLQNRRLQGVMGVLFDFPHITLSHSQTTCPHQFEPRFATEDCQMSCSIKTLFTVNKHRNRPSWYLQVGQKNPWGFIPSQFTCAQVLLFLPSLSVLMCLSVSIHLAGATSLYVLC